MGINAKPSLKIQDYIGFGYRFIAALVDGIILFTFNWGISFILSHALVYTSLSLVYISLISICITFLLYPVYEILMTTKYGATIGKMFMRCVVIDLSGNNISYAQSTGRYFAKYISSFLLFVGYFMILWDKKKQGLHDKIAKTYVVFYPKTKISSPVRNTIIVLSLFILLLALIYFLSVFIVSIQAEFHKSNLSTNDNEITVSTYCNDKLFWTRDSCLNQLSTSSSLNLSSQLAICSLIDDSESQAACFSTIAVKEWNQSICADLPSVVYTQKLCFKTFNFSIIFLPDNYQQQKILENKSDQLHDELELFFSGLQEGTDYINEAVSYNMNTLSDVQRAEEALSKAKAKRTENRNDLEKINTTLTEIRSLSLDLVSLEKINNFQKSVDFYFQALDASDASIEKEFLYLNFKSYEVHIITIEDSYYDYMDTVWDYLDNGQYDKALIQLNKAIEVDEEVVDMWRELHQQNDIMNMELIDQMWLAESFFLTYLTQLEKDLRAAKTATSDDYMFSSSDALYDDYVENYKVTESEYTELLSVWDTDNFAYYSAQYNALREEGDDIIYELTFSFTLE